MVEHQQAIVLRPAMEQDAAFLNTVYRSVREPELVDMGWPDAQIEAFCAMQHRFRTAGYGQYLPPVECRVVLQAGKPVGMLAVCRNAERWVLVSIELLPAVRGQGIGTELVTQLQHEAATAGVGLRLQATSNNPVVHLYQRCGFTNVADDGMVCQMEWQRGRSRASARKSQSLDANEPTVD